MLIASAAVFACLIGGAKAGEEYERIAVVKPRDAMISAWGKKGGRLYFALNDAIASLDAKGRFFRRAYPVRPPDLVGRFAFDGEDLIYVSRHDQKLKRLRPDGAIVDLSARSEKLARGLSVWMGESGELFALTDTEKGFCINECEMEVLRFTKSGRADGIIKTHRYNLNAAGPRGPAAAKERIGQDPKQDEYWKGVLMSFSDETSRRPCGESDEGPVTIAVNRGPHTYSLSRLDRGLRPTKDALWGIGEDEHIQEVERFEREAMEHALCDRTNGLTLLGWEHSGQMSLYRGKEPIHHAFLGMGDNIYLLLGRGETIAVIQQGGVTPQAQISLLAKKGAKADPNDPLLMHRELSQAKGDRILAKLDNMIDAGWWEDAQAAAEEALAQDPQAQLHEGIRARIAKARAAELVHLSEATGELGDEKRTEARQLADEHPASPLAQYAAALLLRASGDSTGYLAHLERTAKALDAAKESWARYPRLFDLYAARGDVAGMKRLAGKDPILLAKIAKAERKPDQALALIASLPETAELVALRASLQLDAGKLNDAILSFTKVLSERKDPEMQHGLGIAYLRRGLSELAVASLLGATTADPKNTTYVSNLAAAYANLDKKEDALKHLFGALSASPDDPVLRHQLERLSSGAKEAKAGGEVMVLPLAGTGGNAERVGLGDMVASMLITALFESGASIVERSRLDQILAEQKLQATAHFDQETSVRVGKLAGAKRMITGNVAEFSGKLVIDLRSVDIATGRVLGTKSVDTHLEVEALRKALLEASRGLTSK